MAKITDPTYPTISSVTSDDLLMVVDVHNTAESAQGTTSKAQAQNLPYPVTSFNGRTGAIVPVAGDYEASGVGAVSLSAVGAAGGVASLDSGGHVPPAEIPAATTTAVGGIQLGGGTTNFLRGDGTWAAPPGGGGGAVASVFGRTGTVVATTGDYTPSQVGAYPASGGTLTGALIAAHVGLSVSGTTVAVNASLGNDYRLTLTASTWTISNPTSPTDGQNISFRIVQDATGGRTVAWGTAYTFGATGGSAPILLGGANQVTYVGFKYVATSGNWECTGATGQTTPAGVLALQATTTTAYPSGYSLVNGTGTILTWSVPNDGLIHRFFIAASLTVTSAETGGEIDVNWTNPDGTTNVAGQSIYNAGLGTTGGHGAGIYGQVVKAGTTVTVTQASALTAGAAKLWAEIWGS